ncbi:hypothetical protein A4G28_12335 [Mycobacterium ostraviense]|uniref:Uncharacterized protein n=1 Tax=Mycobacterium ostraviense TaxID=2738409 RepID=A0A164CH91_9MYCO|nr:hypothetical protein A4G28_12335 [Mycobacterium ostraviense]
MRDSFIDAEATGSDRIKEASGRVHHKTSAVLHDAESIDASKVGDVGGDDGYAQLQTRATDPDVIGTDQLAPATQLPHHPRVDERDLIIHRDEGVSLAHGGNHRVVGSVESFGEFAQRDRRKEQFGIR